MPISRRQSTVLDHLTSISLAQHGELKALASAGTISWSTKDGEHGKLVEKFRYEVKEHYYREQRRRCCYCSSELHNHKVTYDAEHILNKAEFPEYTFETGNLAVSCKHCNGQKAQKMISTSGLRFTELSRLSADYSIVHPHLDNWGQHLRFDSIERIVVNGDSLKGKATIRVCGITHLNLTRLADHFDFDDLHEAEAALHAFAAETDRGRKQAALSLLQEMAESYGEPGAKAVVGALREELGTAHLEGPSASDAAIASTSTLPAKSIFSSLSNPSSTAVDSTSGGPVALLSNSVKSPPQD